MLRKCASVSTKLNAFHCSSTELHSLFTYTHTHTRRVFRLFPINEQGQPMDKMAGYGRGDRFGLFLKAIERGTRPSKPRAELPSFIESSGLYRSCVDVFFSIERTRFLVSGAGSQSGAVFCSKLCSKYGPCSWHPKSQCDTAPVQTIAVLTRLRIIDFSPPIPLRPLRACKTP